MPALQLAECELMCCSSGPNSHLRLGVDAAQQQLLQGELPEGPPHSELPSGQQMCQPTRQGGREGRPLSNSLYSRPHIAEQHVCKNHSLTCRFLICRVHPMHPMQGEFVAESTCRVPFNTYAYLHGAD